MEAEDEHCFILPKVYMLKKKYRNKAKIQEKKDVHGMKFRISTNKNIKHAGKTCVIFLLHHVKRAPENGI